MTGPLQPRSGRPPITAVLTILSLFTAVGALSQPFLRSWFRPPAHHQPVRGPAYRPAYPPRPPIDRLFLRLDTDGDGRLSPWEIEWAAESLRSLDADENGWLDLEETLPALPRSRSVGVRHKMPFPPRDF